MIKREMEGRVKIALVGAGMFGGEVHLRAYADLQRFGLSPQLGRVGLDKWTRDFSALQFDLVAVATRSEKSAKRAQKNFKKWTGHQPKAYFGATPWDDNLRAFPCLDVIGVAST